MRIDELPRVALHLSAVTAETLVRAIAPRDEPTWQPTDAAAARLAHEAQRRVDAELARFP